MPIEHTFTCACGYRGKDTELLWQTQTDTMKCPQCGLADWTWDEPEEKKAIMPDYGFFQEATDG